MKIFLLSLLIFINAHAYCQDEVYVRTQNQEGVHTYRIPGLATSNKGTLLAVWDNRYANSRDLQGDIDIGLSRSFDQGKTWQQNQQILDMGEWGGLPEKFNGVSDACILVDKNSGRIWVAGLWMYGVHDKNGIWIEGLTQDSSRWEHQWAARGSQPGFTPKQTCQFLLTYSDDDGETWAKPLNITKKTKKKEWWLYAPAPGAGITMSDGTLVFPTQGRDENGVPFSNITYSKNGGKSWITSQPASTNTTECSVVELADGSLMLNMRDNRNNSEKGDKNGRAIYTSNNLGNTWTEHPTSHGALIESTCMASLYKHTYKNEAGEEKSILLFSNPATKQGRHNMRLKASLDDGSSWSEGILLDQGNSYGYSCITAVDENNVGVLYEGSRAQMSFKIVPLDTILRDCLNL